MNRHSRQKAKPSMRRKEPMRRFTLRRKPCANTRRYRASGTHGKNATRLRPEMEMLCMRTQFRHRRLSFWRRRHDARRCDQPLHNRRPLAPMQRVRKTGATCRRCYLATRRTVWAASLSCAFCGRRVYLQRVQAPRVQANVRVRDMQPHQKA